MGREFRKDSRRTGLAVAGSIVVLLLFAVSLLAAWLAPYDPNAIDLKRVLAPPSAGHLFGTDPLGRDVLSRMIWGAGISLKVDLSQPGSPSSSEPSSVLWRDITVARWMRSSCALSTSCSVSRRSSSSWR